MQSLPLRLRKSGLVVLLVVLQDFGIQVVGLSRWVLPYM
jgi:hypothetical protein